MISIYNLRKIKAFDRFDLIVSLLKMILSVPIAYRTRCRCLCLPFQSPEPTLHLIPNLISISPTTSVCTSMPAHQPISPQVCLRHFCLFSAFFDRIWNTPLVSQIVISITCGWACLQRGRSYCKRTPRKAAPGGSSSCFIWPQMLPEDLNCGHSRATNNRDVMR